jgi:hypothetical protein
MFSIPQYLMRDYKSEFHPTAGLRTFACMDINLVSKIKRLVIIALASDDELMESLVLKGGNAIDLAYPPAKKGLSRASYDLDYSIEKGDFRKIWASLPDGSSRPWKGHFANSACR